MHRRKAGREGRLSRSKLDSAEKLILGMESLSADGLVPVSKVAADAAGSLREAVDQQKLAMTLSATVLYAIVIELVLKHIWEQEKGQTARYNHNVLRLFMQLKPATRREMEATYDRCCEAYRDAIEKGRHQLGAEVFAVELADIEDALRWNETAMRDFKYELTPKGKSVPTGMVWSTETLWMVPRNFPNFAVDLTRWAAARED